MSLDNSELKFVIDNILSSLESLIAAIKALNKRLNELESAVDEIKDRLNELERRT